MKKRVISPIQQRTLTVQLDVTPEQIDLFNTAIDFYNQAWQDVVSWCNANKSANKTRLQKEMYHVLRERYPQLPAQFISIVLRDSAGAVKSWNSNNKKRRWQLRTTRKNRTLNYDLRIMSVRGNLLTLSSLQGEKRQRFMINIPQWFNERYPDAKVNASKLSVKKDKILIHLIYRVNKGKEIKGDKVVGIDRGIKKIISTSDGGEYSNARVRGNKRRYAYNRATLQAKGTRSAKRRLKAMSGREKRFISDVNHCISKTLANDPDVATYVLEDLTGIKKRVGEKKSKKAGKKMRSWMGAWSYAELETYIIYKCEHVGKEVVFVDPAYTSQRCNRCGHIDKKSRNKSRFDCTRCGYSADADINASCNIRDKYLFAIDGKAGCSQSPIMDGASSSRPSSDLYGRSN